MNSRLAWLFLSFTSLFLGCEKKPNVVTVEIDDIVENDWANQVRSPGGFSNLIPNELKFGCVSYGDSREERLLELLTEGKPEEQIAAAKELWVGHNRRQVVVVINFLATTAEDREECRKFQLEVQLAMQPEAILREMEEGDYAWGSWLAFLKPDKLFVPLLLEAIQEKPDEDSDVLLEGRSKYYCETILALGNSGDPRALPPLLEILSSTSNVFSGLAADAIGYLGMPEAEPMLIEALHNNHSGWRQVKSCGALAKIGTSKALPSLEILANDKSYHGALNIRGRAKYAIEEISKRELSAETNID